MQLLQLNMYVRNSVVDIQQNFISLTPEHASISGGQELIIRTKTPEEKLSAFANLDTPDGYIYNVPMSLVVDVEFKVPTGKVAKLLIDAVNNKELNAQISAANSTDNTTDKVRKKVLQEPVSDALAFLTKEGIISNKSQGILSVIAIQLGKKTIGALLKSSKLEDWQTYEGIGAGMLKSLEGVYNYYNLEFK